MREFFRGWRRKAGLAALAMALLLTTGWMRSYVVQDVVLLQRMPTHHVLQSSRGRILWWGVSYSLFLSDKELEESSQEGTSFEWISLDTSEMRVWTSDEIDTEDGSGWLFGGGGFLIGADSDDLNGPMTRRWLCSYSLIVLPLTLLSAWLLLIKPRPAKSAKESSRA